MMRSGLRTSAIRMVLCIARPAAPPTRRLWRRAPPRVAGALAVSSYSQQMIPSRSRARSRPPLRLAFRARTDRPLSATSSRRSRSTTAFPPTRWTWRSASPARRRSSSAFRARSRRPDLRSRSPATLQSRTL
jgi:hypothetical protein